MKSQKKNDPLITYQNRIKKRLSEIDDTYQLIIIGGGIYGAALCWEAAHRGIKTLLVEKEDYASGASSNSLKTIHGGLRSLQSLNIFAVIKGIRERSIYLKIASNYVKTLTCVMPTSRELKRSKLFIGSGLLVFNILNYVVSAFSLRSNKLSRARLLSLKELAYKVSVLASDQYTGAGLWYDAQVQNTERMVLQFIKAANKHNAITLNHTLATNYIKNIEEKQHSLLITDQITGDIKQVNAPIVIDCSSAWSFISQTIPDNKNNDEITFLKSINIVINKKISETAFGINIKQSKTKENRLYFFAPWRDCTIIGTWYSFEKKHPDQSFSKHEAMNFIAEINTVITDQKISLDDICNVHIGSLPARPPESPKQSNIDKLLLNRYEFKDWSEELGTEPHLYSLRGTKYTLARYDAKQVVDHLASLKKWRITESSSAVIPLYQEASRQEIPHDIPRHVYENLVINYGEDVDKIIQFTKEVPGSSEIIPGTEINIKAEIYHAVLNEQALTLTDLLKRRLNVGDRTLPLIETSHYCTNTMQEILSWSDDTANIQIADLYASYPSFLSDNIKPSQNPPDNQTVS